MRPSDSQGQRGLSSILTRDGGHRASAKPAPWYSGIGARQALDLRNGRLAANVADNAASFSDEIFEVGKVCSRLLSGFTFGVMRRPFNVCMSECCLC